MPGFTVRRLDEATWPGFAALVERHNGIFGGCWCLSFHGEGKPGTLSVADRSAAKQKRVREGSAHAALIYDGDTCVGWCQFGSPDELPRIKNRKPYEEGLTALPTWRITCFFVDKTHRRRGVAAAALGGALEQIAGLGGGTVEAYPEDLEGRSTSPTFLHAGTLEMFERAGFERERKIGKNKWVVRKRVRRGRRAA